jgi:histone chaperone ASF1
LEVTVVFFICLYNDKEFVRVGYYVNNEYTDEQLRENPPEQVLVDQLQRNILADKPKVTR